MPFSESEQAAIKQFMAAGDYNHIWYNFQRKWQRLGFNNMEEEKFRQYLAAHFEISQPTTEDTNFISGKLFPTMAFIVDDKPDNVSAVRLKEIAQVLRDLGATVDIYPLTESDIADHNFYIISGEFDVSVLSKVDSSLNRVRRYEVAPEVASSSSSLREEAFRFLFGLYDITPPKVTIIVPTKNRAWCLPRAIKSILANDYPNLEIFVSDCASTDTTQEVMQEFKDDPRVVFHSHPHKTGAEAQNYAMQNSTGEYVGYLGDDDFYDKNQIVRLAFYLATHPDRYAAFSDGQTLNTNTCLKTYNVYQRAFLDFNTLLEENYINGQTVMHKNNKEVMADLTVPIKYGEDHLQWLYIAAKYGWAHLPFFSGTYTIGHSDRQGVTFQNSREEVMQFNRKFAMEHYMPLRRKNKNDFHIAIFSGYYGHTISAGPAAQQFNLIDALTCAGFDVAVITDHPETIDMASPQHPHRIIQTEKFFRYHVREFNVFHIFGGVDAMMRLKKFGIRPICGSAIVTNCGFPNMIELCGVFKNRDDWESSRAGDQATLQSMGAMFWVAQSAFQERAYRELCHYDGRVMRLRNAIDTENKFPFTPMSDRPKTVIWTGHAGRGKGFPEFKVLAKAMKDVQFTVLSMSRIPNTDPMPNVRYIFGRCSDEMPQTLTDGCVLLTTSLCENQPMAVLEAMATGLPVVAFSSESGMDEIVHDGFNGRLVPFLDVPAMEKAIRDLLNNDTLRAEMGQHARDYVVQNFSYQSCVEQYLDICGEYLDTEARAKLSSRRSKK